MAEPRLIEIKDLDPSEIDVTERMRPFSELGVETLMASIEELGLVKDEIYVRKVKHQNGKLKLMAGGNRLEACRRLGRKVPAKIWDCTDDWAELLEIDDNLAGADLNVLDTAVFLAARKRVYERLHPEVKRGAFKGNRHTGSLVTDIMSFTRKTGEKYRVGERQIYRLLAIGEAMDALEIKALREFPNEVTFSDLQALAKVADRNVRYDIILGMRSGTFRKAAEGAKFYKTGSKPTVKIPTKDTVKALTSIWARASKEAKMGFVKAELKLLKSMVTECVKEAGSNE